MAASILNFAAAAVRDGIFFCGEIGEEVGFVAGEAVSEFAAAKTRRCVATGGGDGDQALRADFRWGREHRAEDFADGCEVVVGDPLAEFDEFGSKGGGMVDGFGDVADFCVLGGGGGEIDDYADEGFFAEGDLDAGARTDDFAEVVGDGVGEERAEGDGEGDVGVGGGGHGRG